MKAAALALMLVAASLAALAADGPLPPGTVAVVNGQPLARGLLDELARARSAGNAPPEMQDRRRMLDDLVDMELMSQRAQINGVAARPQTRAELDLAHKTLLGQYLLRQMAAEMTITEPELKAHYDALPTDVKIDASHILVKDEATARNLIGQLKRGASFASLARQHTLDTQTAARGGALGPLSASQLVPAFATAAQALKPGQTTAEPVKTEFGWHVIRLTSLRAEPKPAFEAVKDELRQQIAQARLQAQLAQWRKEAKLTLQPAP